MMIIYVLLKIIKNSLEFYNMMMIIMIVRSCLIPYLNYNIEQYYDIDIIIIQSNYLFLFVLL